MGNFNCTIRDIPDGNEPLYYLIKEMSFVLTLKIKFLNFGMPYKGCRKAIEKINLSVCK